VTMRLPTPGHTATGMQAVPASSPLPCAAIAINDSPPMPLAYYQRCKDSDICVIFFTLGYGVRHTGKAEAPQPAAPPWRIGSVLVPQRRRNAEVIP
jgi:hypothetical protein